MSSDHLRRLGKQPNVLPLLDGQGSSRRSPRFRPFFPPSGGESQGASTAGRGMGEDDQQAQLQRMADEWAAKLAEVDKVLQQAHQRADALAEQARTEGYQAGYEEGYAKGYAEGMEAAQHSLDQEVAQVRAVAQAAARARQQMLEDLEEEVVSLALAVARKVIGDEAQRSEAVIAQVVQKAIRQLGRRGPYRIRLNPRDAQRLMERWGDRDELDGVEWELVPDERITPGGCILESGVAVIDARLEVQFERLWRGLLGVQDTALAQELSDEPGD
ncbi:MAG: hypothetical protein J7M34_08160 [Anaerolineae bacterium]|nr:hypothetical protein [Anaerolineae bacterium]